MELVSYLFSCFALAFCHQDAMGRYFDTDASWYNRFNWNIPNTGTWKKKNQWLVSHANIHVQCTYNIVLIVWISMHFAFLFVENTWTIPHFKVHKRWRHFGMVQNNSFVTTVGKVLLRDYFCIILICLRTKVIFLKNSYQQKCTCFTKKSERKYFIKQWTGFTTKS